MQKHKETILGWLILFGLLCHYFFGYFLWDKIGTEKLYTITVYFTGDVGGLVIVILSNKNFLKGAGFLAMLLATFYFYMEFNDPYNWRVVHYRSLATLIISLVNLFFFWHYTNLFKRLKIKK